MAELCLIIETPCAGDAGYRFLTSSAVPGEAAVARQVAEAHRQPVGGSYISVSRQARQSLDNSSVREGTERIILQGVAAWSLPPDDIEAVQRALTQLFSPLEKLTGEIDWQATARSTVVVRPELRDWLASPEFRGLPLTKSPLSLGRETQREKSHKQGGASLLKLALVAISLMAIVGVAVTAGVFLNADGAPDKPPAANPPRNTALQHLAQEWSCTENKLAASLLRAENWDRREETNIIGSGALLLDGEVVAILARIKASSPPARFLVSPALQHEHGFHRFVKAHGAGSADQTRKLRRWLFTCWQNFAGLKQTGSRVEESMRRLSDKDACSRFILRACDFQLDIGTGDGFVKPETPLFDRQDVMIYHMLTGICQDLRETGVLLALDADRGNDTSELASLLAGLEKSRDAIPGMIDDSRDVSLRTAPANLVAIRDEAFPSLKEFLLHLSTFGRL